MLNWKEVVEFGNGNNPAPDKVVRKTDEEWRAQLTPEQYRVTRQAGTERPFSSEMCSLFEPGLYACVCCDALLFDAGEKFESGTGWPSFTQPVTKNAVAYNTDNSHGMTRIEAVCNTCQAHLGHVFPDGPPPGGLRYCMNAVSLKKADKQAAQLATATFGGGCFWCTEAMFQKLRGVHAVASGYSGGDASTANYKAVCSGTTDHAEVIQVLFDPAEISYADLLQVHMLTHNPTTLNQQGADKGTQYRSVIFVHDDEQRRVAEEVLARLQADFDQPVVTQVVPFEAFYKAEDYHQNYYELNTGAGYCQVVISPKLHKLRSLFSEKLAV
jgi:peptide methionine sulfoxide reductase msrA/msrB